MDPPKPRTHPRVETAMYTLCLYLCEARKYNTLFIAKKTLYKHGNAQLLMPLDVTHPFRYRAEGCLT